MQAGTGALLPIGQLHDLEFLIGDSSGPGIVCPPGRSPVPFTGHLHAEREECDRFMKLEFFGQVPIMGIESIHSVITYSEKEACYRMWSFCTSQDDPIEMRGNFEGRSLVFLSDPTRMAWGMERMRCAFTALAEGVVDYCAELWTIEGYVPYFRATYSHATSFAF